MKVSELPKTDAKLQMLFHRGNVNFVNDDSNTIEIGPDQTLDMAKKIGNEKGMWEYLLANEQFMKLFRMVFPEKDFPNPGECGLLQHGNGMRHVVGLIVLIRSAQAQGKRPFIRFPESFLHPAQQCGLGDLLIKI